MARTLLQYDYGPASQRGYKPGHVIKSIRNSTVISCYQYDITGMMIGGTDKTTSWSATPANNNAVAGAITVGSLTTDLDWTAFLALHQTTGPNSDTATSTYDEHGRPLV